MNPTKNPTPDKIDSLWVNVHLATMTEAVPYGMVENGALAVYGKKITWVGKRNELPVDLDSWAVEIYDGQGGWITPGLVDCHTHLVYGGSRAREFELRLKGATYEEIARQGGGIRSTVTATRQADEESLLKQSAPRLVALMQEGVTTVEIKSGYGLDLETEMRMLRVEVMRAIKRAFNGAMTPMMQFLLDSGELSPEQLDDLEAMIRSKKEETKIN